MILYFSEEVAGYLYDYYGIRIADKTLKNEPALFLSLQKRRITTRAVENIVKKYSLVATPLKHITPHKLRSTFGTQLYRNTGDIYVVADVLGHKDVNTTKRHYAAITEDIRRSASTKVRLYADKRQRPTPQYPKGVRMNKIAVENVALVYVELPTSRPEQDLYELGELIDTAQGDLKMTITQKRNVADPKTVVGRGKLEEIKRSIELANDKLTSLFFRAR